MKKKILFTLLALFVCASLLFVSCDKETAPEETTAPETEETKDQEIDIEAGKATVVKYIKDDTSATADMNAESLLKDLKMTAEFDMNAMGETAEFNMAMKDGLLYLDMDDAAYYVLMQGEEVLTFAKMPNGQWTLVEDEAEEAPEEDADDEALMMMLQNISYDKLSVEHIDYVNGKFVLKNDFLVDACMDALIEQLTGGEVFESPEMDAAIAEARANFEKMIEGMNPELSFRVSEDEVTQINASIELDSAAMQELGMVETGVNASWKIKASVDLANGGKSIKAASFEMKCYESGGIDIEMELGIQVRSETRVTVSGKIISLGVTVSMDGTILLDDASGFPSKIPTVVQEYMK